MSDDPKDPDNFEAAKTANHLGKSIAIYVPVTLHKDVWLVLFDEVKKQGWKVKDEPTKQ